MKKIFSVSVLVASLLWAFDLWARAGGGGGGHGGGGGGFGGGGYGGGAHYGGGGGGGNLDLIILLMYLLGRPWGWGVLLFAAWIGWLVLKNMGANADSSGGGGAADEQRWVMAEAIPLPPEEVQQLQEKAKVAFLVIQDAWSKKQTTTMRRFISDGVYQRFHAQFTVMNILDQTNVISQIGIRSLRPVHYFVEGDYESIDIEITAEATDQFVSEKYPQFNSPGGHEGFTEYWSFIRRKDRPHNADIFHQTQCPKCAAPLDDKLMETARCPYCGVYINSGEFDWVLSEITQPGYYRRSVFQVPREELAAEVQTLETQSPHFSRHVLEDRASNAFLQVMIGQMKGDTQSQQRFCTPEFFASLQQPAKDSYVYDRLYIESVELLKLEFLPESLVRAYIGIVVSFRRVSLEGSKAQLLDPEIVQRNYQISLIHQNSAQPAKASIYANACPKCGAPQKDSLSAVCEYCGSVLNDPRGDWILESWKSN